MPNAGWKMKMYDIRLFAQTNCYYFYMYKIRLRIGFHWQFPFKFGNKNDNFTSFTANKPSNQTKAVKSLETINYDEKINTLKMVE